MSHDTAAPAKSETPDVVGDLANIILHLYPRGRIIVAVDGAEATVTRGFADALATAARANGRPVDRQSMDKLLELSGATNEAAAGADGSLYDQPVDYGRFRTETLAGFRRGDFDPAAGAAADAGGADAVLIVDGRFLLRPDLRGSWNYRVWLEGDQCRR